MATIKDMLLQLLVLFWWVGLWNVLDIILNSNVPPEHFFQI